MINGSMSIVFVYNDSKIAQHAPQISSNVRHSLTPPNKTPKPEMCANDGATPKVAEESCCLGVPTRRTTISEEILVLAQIRRPQEAWLN